MHLTDLGPSREYFGPFVPSRHIAYYDPADDYVPNPGMGFVCYLHNEHMIGSSNYSPFRREFEEAVELPYCDNLYVRPEWFEVQKEPGRLDLPSIWQWTLEAAEKHGKGWSLRIMPSSPHSLRDKSTPPFLDDKLQFIAYDDSPVGTFPGPKVKHFPVYNEAYLTAWGELLRLLGEQFDAHPRLEFADISGYGKWGEWHHWPQDATEGEHQAPAMRRLIDDHIAAFPNTPAVMLLTPSHHLWKDQVLAHALDRGAGLRRDSFYPLFTPWECRAVAEVRKPGTPYVYEPGMVPGHRVFQDDGHPPMDYERIYQPILDTGCSYVGLGFNPRDLISTHARYPQMLQRISRKLGYRIRPAIVWMKRAAGPERKWLILGLMNDGGAPPTGTLTITARFDRGPKLVHELPAAFPAPGRLQLVEINLPESFSDFGNGNALTLSLTLRFGQKQLPVRWSVRPAEGVSQDRRSLRIPVPPAITGTGSRDAAG